MKFLIGICAFFIVRLINEILGSTLGFKFGYVIVPLLAVALAKPLNKMWDNSQFEKKFEKNVEKIDKSAKQLGLTRFEYTLSIVPGSVKDGCEERATDIIKLEHYLNKVVNSELIDQTKAKILLQGYKDRNCN